MSLIRQNRFNRVGSLRNPGAIVSAGRATGNALLKAYKIGRRGRSGNQVSSADTAAITTDHHDASVVYKRRRKPYGQRKQWVKFVKKVKRVMEGDASPKYQIILKNQSITSIANKQAYSTVSTALGAYGTAADYTDDIKELITRDTGINRIHLTGMLMETMVANTGTTTAYVDCYYWVCRKSVPSNFSGIGQLWQWGLDELLVRLPAMGGSSLDTQDYGVTPFQSNQFTRHINVYKKIRIKLGAGETTQLKVGKKMSKYANSSAMTRFSLIQGLSQGIIFVAYGTPSATNTTANPVTVSFSVNKNFTYRVLDTTAPSGGTTQN